MSSATARAARCLLALSLFAAGTGCARTSGGNTVTILIPWAAKSAEYNAFFSVVTPFAQRHGFQVIPEYSLAPTQQLVEDKAARDLPDLADLPSPAALDQFKGELKPLAIDLSSYDEPWRDLAKLGTDTVYAVPVKADVKSLLWYKTSVLPSPPLSWTGLEKLSGHGTPWCLGLAAGSASGWPGADWVADILLSRYTATAYEDWLDGHPGWESTDVLHAWKMWGKLMRYGAGIYGGVSAALGKMFNDTKLASGNCELQHGALSATGLTSTVGYGYKQFPSISGAASPILVSGDFMGLFKNNPDAEELLAYLASSWAQRRWVHQPGGYAFSADRAVNSSAYRTRVQRQIAKQFLLPGHSSVLCFSAEDMMQSDVTTAFEQAVLDYVDKPRSLGVLLNDLNMTQQGAGSSPLAASACTKP